MFHINKQKRYKQKSKQDVPIFTCLTGNVEYSDMQRVSVNTSHMILRWWVYAINKAYNKTETLCKLYV